MPLGQATLLDIIVTTAVTGQVLGPEMSFQESVLESREHGAIYGLATLPAGYVAVPRSLGLYAQFAYGSGGTTLKAWVQTSFDAATWFDIACFAFLLANKTRAFNLTDVAVTSIATPADGTTADDTAVNGLLGHRYRVKVTSTGTYAGNSRLVILAQPRP